MKTPRMIFDDARHALHEAVRAEEDAARRYACAVDHAGGDTTVDVVEARRFYEASQLMTEACAAVFASARNDYASERVKAGEGPDDVPADAASRAER